MLHTFLCLMITVHGQLWHLRQEKSLAWPTVHINAHTANSPLKRLKRSVFLGPQRYPCATKIRDKPPWESCFPHCLKPHFAKGRAKMTHLQKERKNLIFASNLWSRGTARGGLKRAAPISASQALLLLYTQAWHSDPAAEGCLGTLLRYCKEAEAVCTALTAVWWH